MNVLRNCNRPLGATHQLIPPARGAPRSRIPRGPFSRNRRQFSRRSDVLPAATSEVHIDSNNVRSGRVAQVSRETKETKVKVSLNLDGTGVCTANTPVHFLNHMLDQLASHGLFNVNVDAEGDTWIDDHHTCEDIALALGSALSQALGDRKGIHRFGNFTAPLDEALVQVVLDLSGRPHLTCQLDIPSERIGTFDTQLVDHFFQSLVNTSGITLHIRQLDGVNSHHIVEATFKAFARALRQATEYDPRREGMIASSKGVLTQQ
ncbi:hypothetical protein BSKO_08034 [Bryopsis sp. KO-2023]|nr:hypothetical protein BSKO_08034 [Bryopsis sp. KO-2023]